MASATETVTPEEATQLFEQNLSQAEEEARRQAAEEIQRQKQEAYQKFLEELQAKKQEYAEAIAMKLKRQAVGYYPSPREITKEREKLLAEWEAQERARAEQELAAWEQQAWSEIEQQLQQEKEKAKKEFETKLAEAIVKVPEQAPSFAEQILNLPSLNLWDWLGIKRYPSPLISYPQYEQSKFLVAGFVGSLESIVYGVSDLAGFLLQGLRVMEYSPTWHPRYPPTVTGALLTSGVESALAGTLKPSEEMQQLYAMHEKYGTPATIMYGAGSILGDVFAAYVGSKAFEVGKKAVSKAAAELSEATGWKYSHLHYVLHEKKLAILEALPKSPITSFKQSHLAYELSKVKSDLAHSILPTKYMRYPAREIVSFPSVFEASAKRLPESWLMKASGIEAAQHVAWELAATPRAAGFGYTLAADLFKPTSIAKETAKELAEKLVAFGWFKAVSPKEVPMPSDWVVGFKKTPEEFAFEKLTYRSTMPSDWILGFEKPKGLSLKDLLKSEKASAVLVSPLEMGKKVIEKGYVFGETVLKPRISKASFSSYALFIGLKAYPQPAVSPSTMSKIKPIQFSGIKAKVSPIQAVVPRYVLNLQPRLRQVGKTVYAPRLPFKARKGKAFERKPSMDIFGAEVGVWQYPVATPKQALKVLVMPKNVRRVKRK